MDHPFRSAMFGGFNRQDVLEYLENSAQQAAQQQQELQAQLDQARQELTDRQSQESDGQEQLEKAQQEAEALQSQLDQANADLTISRETVSRLSEELEQARQELQTWKDKAAALEPDAQAYAALKERAAGLELDAHRRAQLVQDQAEGQVRQLHEQMAQWSNQVRLEYEALRAEVESTVTHAARQLEQAGKAPGPGERPDGAPGGRDDHHRRRKPEAAGGINRQGADRAIFCPPSVFLHIPPVFRVYFPGRLALFSLGAYNKTTN